MEFLEKLELMQIRLLELQPGLPFDWPAIQPLHQLPVAFRLEDFE